MMPPLIPVAVALLVGVLAAFRATGAPFVLIGLGIAGALTSLVVRRSPKIGFVALLVLWMSLGMLRTEVWQHQPPHDVARLVAEEPTAVLVHGVVVDDPVDTFAPGEPEQRVLVLQARHARMGTTWRLVTGLIRARLQQPRTALAYGDDVLLEGGWSTVPAPGNPGQYDWRAALARQQIQVLLTAAPYHGLVRLKAGKGRPGFRLIYRLRHRLEQLLDGHFDPSHAGLLRSFLLGQRVALDERLKRAFVETGTMHSLARQCTKLHRDSPASHVTYFKAVD